MYKPNYIPYFKPQECDFGTLSIDKLIITGKVIHGQKQRLANYISRKSDLMPGWKLYDKNTCPLKFRTFADMIYDTEGNDPIGMTVQIGRNDFNNRVNDEIRIELNPNKLFDKNYNLNADEAKKDYRRILDSCRTLKVIEFDIALDIPTERQNVTIMPNNKRTYTRINGKECQPTDDKCHQANADDYTQYVGQRHTNGYTKVYNKQIERQLSKPMTRVEITIKTEEYKKDFAWTRIYYRPPGDDSQLTLDKYKPPTEEERLILRLVAMLQVPSEQIATFKSRKLKEKYKSLILAEYKELKPIDIPLFDTSVTHIQDFVNDTIFAEEPQDIEYNEDRFLSRNIYLRKISKRHFVPYSTIRDTSDEEFNKAVIFFAKAQNIDISSHGKYAYCTPTAPASLNQKWEICLDEEIPF